MNKTKQNHSSIRCEVNNMSVQSEIAPQTMGRAAVGVEKRREREGRK